MDKEEKLRAWLCTFCGNYCVLFMDFIGISLNGMADIYT
jgi:hypothetical protein